MKENILFGSSFETSLRILMLLDELNLALDKNQISCIDFMAIYGADFDLLDENLHGNGLFRFSEFSAKSLVITETIKHLVVDSLISFVSTPAGYSYTINDIGKNAIARISDSYEKEYRIAVRAVQNAFPDFHSDQMQQKIFNTTISSLEVEDE